jgi:hypothetical protein
MIKMLLRAAVLSLFAATLAPALHAQPGTSVHLLALPSYVQRVFLPVVPGAANTLSIDAMPVDAVRNVPAGFDVQVRNGGLVVQSTSVEGFGYAKVLAGGRELTLTLVSTVPYSEMRNGVLDGYRVGEYAAPLKGLPSYERPKGFIRLTRANASVAVADHYRMSDFQCKLDGDTKYLVLRTEALLKLEILQHELATREGLRFDRFTVMSGYRTPYYNAKIGNETGSSRHLYGDAMDIYVDANHDGTMDDVNRDGRVDAGDARFILRVATEIDESPEWGWLKGGAGVYHANAAHGPYIHVDARGYVARWGAVEEGSGRSVAAR